LFINATALAVVSTLVISGGSSLTNVTNEVGSVRTLSATDSAFYKLSIVAEEYNLIQACQDGLDGLLAGEGDIISFDCVSDYGKQYTLVAPNIAIGCAHHHVDANDVVSFGGYTAIVTRVVFPAEYIPGTGGNEDYTFIELDRDLPVKPALLAPTNLPAYMGTTGSFVGYDGIVMLNVDRYGEVGVQKMTVLTPFFIGGEPFETGVYAPYSRVIDGGDSGSPCFLVIEGQLVLIGVYTSSSSVTSPYNDLIEIDTKRRFL
jgi:hypothetical protein